MATKAELAAELALLRQQLAERDTAPVPEPEPEPDDPTTAPDLAKTLADHGLDISDPAELLKQLTKELEGLAQDKPLLTAATAFGLGFALGRMSK